MDKAFIKKMREFNRFYTDFLGSLNNRVLNSKYSPAAARILFEIGSKTDCTAGAIVSILNIDKSYLSRILKSMEKDKLISKRRSDADARSVYLQLTEKGRSELRSLEDEVISRLCLLESNLTTAQCTLLSKNMEEIRTILSGM
ncbi:MAG TPA: MarR family transcriptional regulator [Ignavibacteria bacterium]|nr:MarR family transcriptional regulator [Ignavibacteria bacterium]HMQ99681.1 MarR family transcriptional regulator [Ignavibacteria bacterium]